MNRDAKDLGGAADRLARSAREVSLLPDKQAARTALPDGALRVAGNRFFRDATGKSRDFKLTPTADGGYRMEFFSPANNAGYGKLYVQVIDRAGKVIAEFKDTMGPEGLIERKVVHGP